MPLFRSTVIANEAEEKSVGVKQSLCNGVRTKDLLRRSYEMEMG